MNDTDRVLSLAHADPSDPYAQADALRRAAADYQGDSGVLRAGLSGIEAEMRRRGVPGATSESVIEGTIREDMPRIIADDLMYRSITDIGRELDPSRGDDVDLRSVAELYMEVIDILVVEYREACRECRSFPSEENLSDAMGIMDLIGQVLKAASYHLTLHSTESPASYRRKAMKALMRCKEHTDSVVHGTAIDAPELDKRFADVSEMFAQVSQEPRLAEVQEERNELYRADREWLRAYLSKRIMEMNGEMEALDLTDFTQRRYLAHLISLSQDVLNDLDSNH